MTIDIEEHGPPESLSPADWRTLVQMLKNADAAQRSAQYVSEVLGEDVVELIMLARQCDGQTLAQIQ